MTIMNNAFNLADSMPANDTGEPLHPNALECDADGLQVPSYLPDASVFETIASREFR
jgi:hypothetical protein